MLIWLYTVKFFSFSHDLPNKVQQLTDSEMTVDSKHSGSSQLAPKGITQLQAANSPIVAS